MAYGYLGSLQHERGRLEEARLCYEDALVSVKNGPASSGIHGVFRASYGALLAMLGNTVEARRELDAASAMLPDWGEWAAYVAVHRGHLDLALAREREAAGDRCEAERLQAQAALRLGNGDGAGEDLRCARRLLARELEALHPGPGTVLVIGPDAQWFRLGKGPVINLHTRRQLRILMLAFGRARLDRPGEPLYIDLLLHEGWKGERVSAYAGKNRLRVALSELRARGLGDAIARRDDGYLLAPSVRVVMSDDRMPVELAITRRRRRRSS
jgi:hypothetical protein